MAVRKGNNFKLIKKHMKHGEWGLLVMKGLHFVLERISVIFLMQYIVVH